MMQRLKKQALIYHETHTRNAGKFGSQDDSTVSSMSPPQSRTMMYARATVQPPSPTKALSTVNAVVAVPPTVRPRSTAEQYWAARALTAEALLSARVAHQGELSVAISSAEEKREREMAALQRSYDERHRKLERLVAVLLTCLVAFASAILYMLSCNMKTKPSSRLTLPSHFTIPILSPFTSVVEHETSVINMRLIALCSLVLAGLAYACFRYWLTHVRRS